MRGLINGNRLCYLLIPLVACAIGTEVCAFMMTSPTEGTVLRSGQQISTSVDLGKENAFGQIRYYWYRPGEEPLASHQTSPALTVTADTVPPYSGTLVVPHEALGPMRLLAVAEIISGRLAGREEFDEVIIQVEPPAALSRIEFETEKPLRLDVLGKTLDLPAVGQFADGVTRPLQGSAAGTTYRSSNERVVTVSMEGRLQVVGNGTASITVSNRGQEGTLDVIVKTDGEINRFPIAHAGPDLTVKGGSKVVLNGLRSVDPDGDPLRYEWKQVRGNKVPLLDFDSPKATFVAPHVSARRLLQFMLRVTDMKGPDSVKGADSLPSFVNVWVEP